MTAQNSVVEEAPKEEINDYLGQDPLEDLHELVKQHRVLFEKGEANPLDDDAFEKLAEITEIGNGSNPAFRIVIKRYITEHHCRLFPEKEKGKAVTDAQMTRFRIWSSTENDVDYLLRLKKRYSNKYPKTLELLLDGMKVK